MLNDEPLEEWARRGDPLSAWYTYETVKDALEGAVLDGMRYEIYPQGSYAAKTNIAGDSDVDMVIALQSPFYAASSDLDPPQRAEFYKRHEEDSEVAWQSFREVVVRLLESRFRVVSKGKCVQLHAEILTLDADVLVALDYRHYKKFFDYANQEFDAGVQFFAGDRDIVNHPRQHIANGNLKDWATLGMFKPVVRIMKNARNAILKADSPSIESSTAPSYYVDALKRSQSTGARPERSRRRLRRIRRHPMVEPF
jgi:predicted nucleotidyltransferase